MQVMTLVFLMRDDELLLGMKKRGFGAGRWNGLGGKVRANESIEAAALRELAEEVDVRAEVGDLQKRAVVRFHSPSFEGIEMHVYRLCRWQGEPKESEEMRPTWYKLNQLPFDSMWPDDPFWLPRFIDGDEFTTEFWFDEHDQVLRHELTVAQIA